MNIKNIIITILVAVAVSIAFWFFQPVEQVVVTPAGALAGPDIPSQYLAVGGVRKEYRSQDYTVGTTTPCSVVSPSSTSTLRFASNRISTASTTATTWTLAKATGPNATTTVLANRWSLGSGAYGTMVYQPSATSTAGFSNDPADVIAPNTYLTWGVAGISGFTSPSSMAGTCDFEFIVN